MIRTNFILFMFLASCMSSHRFAQVSLESRFITYDEVRVKIETKTLDNITLKGYVSIVHDSLVCFDFWGPLGYKAFSGEISEHFKLNDYYNQRSSANILSELINQSGLIFNRTCIEDIFLGRVDSLIEVLSMLNKSIIKIESDVKGQNQFLVIVNDARKNNFKLEFFKNKLFPRKITIKYSDSVNKWVIQLEILSISNEKKCYN